MLKTVYLYLSVLPDTYEAPFYYKTHILWHHKIDFLMSQIRFFWYHKFDFFIWQNNPEFFFLYQKIEFLIS